MTTASICTSALHGNASLATGIGVVEKTVALVQ